MIPRWALATKILLTLAMKTSDWMEGLDLVNTVEKHKDLNNVEKAAILTRPRNSMHGIRHAMGPEDKEDMRQRLDTIFEEYSKSPNKRMTPVVPIDGLWQRSQTANDVEEAIPFSIKELKGRTEQR